MNLEKVNSIQKSIDDLLKDLEVFFDTHEHVYIYGAGVWANYIFNICQRRNYRIEGFITTKKEKYIYNNLKVLNVQDGFSEPIDGVIPGFKGFTDKLLESNNIVCDYLNNSCLRYCYYIYYRDLLEKILFKNDYVDEGQVSWDNILVIRLDAIGDLICTTPLYREIKRNYPSSNITLLCQEDNKAIVEDNANIDEIITIKGNRYMKSKCLEDEIEECSIVAKDIIKSRICDRSFDRVILATHVLEGGNAHLSLMVALLVKCKKVMAWQQLNNERRMFYPYILNPFNFDITMVSEPKHEIDNILEMLIQNGIRVVDNRIDICSDKDFLEGGISYKKRQSGVKYVAVGIVGSQPKKNWPADKYNRLFREFKDGRFMFVLLGGKDAIEADSKIDKCSNIISLVNKMSLKESMQVISGCDCYLGSNTGLMHIAAGFGKPCVTIYASSKDASPWDEVGPNRWGVRDAPHIDILLDYCLDDCVGSCNKNYSHCINQISVDEVKQAIIDIMEN